MKFYLSGVMCFFCVPRVPSLLERVIFEKFFFDENPKMSLGPNLSLLEE
jgi:hypothetical protein